MIAVETVIRKLIGEYEFVIIPGFGALLSHQVPAVYDGNSGIFAPPVKRLAFNEYLKLDDGLLANYISRHEKVTHADAVEYVKGYTDRLRSGLDIHGEASITGIGEFKQNVEGKLVFEPNTGKYFKDEWYGFEKIKTVEVQARPVAALNSAQYISDDVEVVELETEARPRRWTGWAAAAVIAGLLCGLSFFLVNTENEYIKSTLNPFSEMFSRKDAVETTVVKSEEVKTPEPAPVREEIVAKVDSMPVDSAPVNPVETVASTPAPAPAAIEAKPVEIASAKFYVIAGAFKGTKQANVLLAELTKKGFTKALIIPGDERSKKVKVAVDGFDNETDAYRASNELKKVIGEAGWVFKKK
ncbi:Sporulation related domain-containing protein [Dyadobacter sp. SG02]|uniref:HU domain-containing protein n=1 Tax=Dyadobacter sp. SG02 TaxID=1855291 RepID=UPI0008D310C1|nr:SPOR domain-containing protein [Dyadobacter sp. SG02]SEJ62484.1 Sporulation related domain-containing protein [Dyadobacter sp. SG02]